MVKKYQKKPVVVEAVLWTGAEEDVDEIVEFMNTDRQSTCVFGYSIDSIRNLRNLRLVIHTLEGDMIADPGDFIIKGVKGEFYPCKPDIFDQTYEPYIDVTI